MIVLESERLLFRQHDTADVDAFCAMEMDAEVRRYVGGSPRSRDEAKRRFLEGPLQVSSDRLGVWATILKSTEQYVGRCGLYPHFRQSGGVVAGEATLSFYIAREYWGQGLASEAAGAFVEFGWKQLQLSRIVSTVQVGNGASVHILEKLGFDLIATEQGKQSFYKFMLQNPKHRKAER